MHRREFYQRIEKSITGEQIGAEMVALHLVEYLGGKVRFSRLNIGTNGSIKKGFGRSWKSSVWMEEGLVEMVLPIRGNKRDKEGFGIRKLLVAEERRKEGEEGIWGLSEGGDSGL